MTNPRYFTTLFRFENFPLLLITLTVLFFTALFWFWLPLYILPELSGIGVLLISGIVFGLPIALIFLPLNYTVAKKNAEGDGSIKVLVAKYSAATFLAGCLIYFGSWIGIYFLA
ncbi:hypothetical protein ACF3OH_02140 [Chryseomicrobium aureum]|uniref:hypothetical protein n=1 Tax=Chryseomicrobium aureum TaxID=1441723 RepID=UPI00370D9054